MLLYIDCAEFPCRTFVVRVQPEETIARVRAQILHILYELGRENLMFRLRFNGIFLKDAYIVEDYSLVENSVIKMVPISNEDDNPYFDQSSTSTDSYNTAKNYGVLPQACRALEKEVKAFKWRERLILDFKSMLMGHFMLCWFGLLSSFWYACLWMAVLWIGGVLFCPTYTQLGGYMGKASLYKTQFFVFFGLFAICCAGGSGYLFTKEYLFIMDEGCYGYGNTTCSQQVIFSMVYYSIQVVMFVAHSILAWIILTNMKLEVGDYIEKCLVQELDLEKVVKMACSGSTSEKQWAAAELANLAACNDENKFSIVAHNGLRILTTLALSKDPVVQEHAVEALAEVCTIPTIQEEFVNSGDAKLLTALLLSTNTRLVHQTALMLYNIICDSDDYHAMFLDNGLDDLCHAARTVTDPHTQSIIAALFTSLACNKDVRSEMVCRNSPAQALLKLCESVDTSVCLDALQSLEILAIESSDMICAQENLMEFLVQLPLNDQYSKELYIVASKILLYFAENERTCSALVNHRDIGDCVRAYNCVKQATMQRVIIRIIYYCSDTPDSRLRSLGFDKILTDISNNPLDEEIQQMAEKALQDYSDDTLSHLPRMSSRQKLDASMRSMNR